MRLPTATLWGRGWYEMGSFRLCLCLCALAVLRLRECLGQVEGASLHVDLPRHAAAFGVHDMYIMNALLKLAIKKNLHAIAKHLISKLSDLMIA